MDYRWPADVEGYATAQECAYLYRFACAVPQEQAIVELGAYKGRTAIAMAQSRHVVYTVDRFRAESAEFHPLPDHRAGRFSESDIMASAFAYGVDVRVIDGDTAAVGDRVRTATDAIPPSIGLLFIDADHSYEGVSRDWAAWSPMLAPDATVVFDDVLWKGVQRFLAELSDWDPVPGPQAGGMMALRRAPVLATT